MQSNPWTRLHFTYQTNYITHVSRSQHMLSICKLKPASRVAGLRRYRVDGWERSKAGGGSRESIYHLATFQSGGGRAGPGRGGATATLQPHGSIRTTPLGFYWSPPSALLSAGNSAIGSCERHSKRWTGFLRVWLVWEAVEEILISFPPPQIQA